MSGSENASHSYELVLSWRDGRREVLTATADETILEAAEAANVSLPFGCRTGACATCVGCVTDGTVAHSCPPRSLKRRHLEGGYVLCCIARPRSNCAVDVGTAVGTELVSNPWK